MKSVRWNNWWQLLFYICSVLFVIDWLIMGHKKIHIDWNPAGDFLQILLVLSEIIAYHFLSHGKIAVSYV